MHRFILWSLLLIIVAFLPLRQGLAAEEHQLLLVKEFPQKERELKKGVDGVVYDQRSYLFSRTTPVRLLENHILMLTVWSFDFKPTIVVRAEGQKEILQHGALPKAQSHEGRTAWVTNLEFTPPDRGLYAVTISTAEVDQGGYFVQGGIWTAEVPAKADSSRAGDTPTVSLAKKGDDLRSYSFSAKKDINGPRNHWSGGWYAKGGKYAGDIGVSWLEPGDAIASLHKPGERGSLFAKVERQEGDVYYMVPQTSKKNGAEVVSSYGVILAHPTKELYASVNLGADHRHLMPSLIAQARELMKQHENRARPRP